MNESSSPPDALNGGRTTPNAIGNSGYSLALSVSAGGTKAF